MIKVDHIETWGFEHAEKVYTILRQRKGHKLDEWNEFCEILSDLPYIKEIGGIEE